VFQVDRQQTRVRERTNMQVSETTVATVFDAGNIRLAAERPAAMRDDEVLGRAVGKLAHFLP
jgi:hypothetical protein